MRPWTLLKPCELPRKYVGVLDEQPMPESLATRCGGTSRSKNAWMIALEIESCPQPAHSVEAVLSQRPDVEHRQLLADLAHDESRGDRRAVIVQHRDELRRIDDQLVHQQRAQLRVAVLLDDEYLLVLGDEVRHGVVKRERANAQC